MNKKNVSSTESKGMNSHMLQTNKSQTKLSYRRSELLDLSVKAKMKFINLIYCQASLCFVTLEAVMNWKMNNFNDESNRLISWTCSKLIKTMLQLILLRTFCKCSTFKATAVVRVKFLGTLTHCYTPWKRQKTFGFLTFSGGIEMWHWTKMG